MRKPGRTHVIVRRAAAVAALIATATVLAGLSALIWVAVRGGAFLFTWGVALMVAAGLLSITAGGYADRLNGVSHGSVLLTGGTVTSREDLPMAGLTELGVALLVGLPLFLLGGALLLRGS